MRYFQLALAILCAATLQPAHADPISVAQATRASMFMLPNSGLGDNLVFTFTGPGLDISGIGGMGCFDWCSGQPIPADTPTVTSQIFIAVFTRALVGGVEYSPTGEIGGETPFDEFGGLEPVTRIGVGAGDTFKEFDLILPNSTWTLNFAPGTDQEGNPTIAFTNGAFLAEAPLATPEPGTIALMLIGTAGIGWVARRRRMASFV
jgi:hypothetical protein